MANYEIQKLKILCGFQLFKKHDKMTDISNKKNVSYFYCFKNSDKNFYIKLCICFVQY